MKNLKKAAFLVLTIFTTQFYAQGLKSGAVTYEMTLPNNEQAAMMGSSTIKILFNEKSTATQVDMMGGMMAMKTITLDKNNVDDSRMLMDMMGKKYELTGETAAFDKNDFTSLKNAQSVTYDKKDIKDILGYKCYKANIVMEGGVKSAFYITEAIATQSKTTDKLKLSGFPLEMEIGDGESKVVLKATAFDKELSPNSFTVPDGYKKVTQEELQKELGGM